MISDDTLLNEIRRLADDKSPPTIREFADESEYSGRTVANRWGSWNAALQEAGFTPNHKINISDETLLKNLREEAKGQIAPSYEESTAYDPTTYEDRFGTWWKASICAGLRPYYRRPLTDVELKKFFQATIEQQKPKYQLVGLLGQFTGLPPELIVEFSPDWIRTTAGNVIVTVPANRTQSGQRWTFKLPNTWTDEDGEQRDTGLPGVLTWVLEQDGSIDFKNGHSISRALYRIAQDAGLQSRERVHQDKVGGVPLVRYSDLRSTGGVQMARNGAPARRIRRHLGIEHTNWQADVEDFFLWLYVHEGYEHPEYDPPDVVLDSVL